jgi:REP element-mobilizing transposase RayT
MTLYKGKYRSETKRLPSWDYSAEGYYFVTICTARRHSFFGTIMGSKVSLSRIGMIACKEWLKSAQLRQNIELDAFVVMPNHIHGIVIIQNRQCRDALRRVSLQRFGPLVHGSLQAFINNYKGAVTRWCRGNGYSEFAWQARFWDRVIRTEEELHAMRKYIENNPLRWALDQENTEGLWI